MKTTQSRSSLSAEERFGRIGRSIDQLLDKSRTAAAEVKDEIVKEFERIDSQISASRAQVGQDLAFTRDDLVEAFHKELDVWKARVEQLNVQSALGRMELRDRFARALRLVEANLDRIRRDVEELAAAEVVDEEELGYSIKRSMTGLRKEIEEVDQMC